MKKKPRKRRAAKKRKLTPRELAAVNDALTLQLSQTTKELRRLTQASSNLHENYRHNFRCIALALKAIVTHLERFDVASTGNLYDRP